jgi:YaiO family outer membrane protein
MKRALRCVILGTLLLLVMGGSVRAQNDLTRTVDIGFGYGEYDGTLGVARSQSLGLFVSRPYVWDWRINLGRAHRFHTDGWAVGTSFTRHLPRGFNVSVGVGRGSGGVVLADYRFDASVSAGLLPDRQLLLTLSYTRNQSAEVNYSDGVSLGASWYRGRWILGGHFLHDTGYPGKTISRSGGVSLTYSLWRLMDIGGGYTWGDVSYILLNPGEAHVNYSAEGYFLNASRWFGKDWGVNLRLDYGETDFYHFRGFNLGAFKEF